MSFVRFLIHFMLVLLASGLPADKPSPQASERSGASNQLKLSRIFRATINLGAFSSPIPIQGGQRVVAKVNGGTLKGSLSGTITSGISVIDLFNNGQAIMNSIRSIGNTTDGLPFLIDETGVGSQADNFGRVIVSVGGNLAGLANQILITDATLSPDQKSVETDGYVVLNR
ncbi:MAG: hypothetical protein LQ348_006524 [Seirophora lacunosa]|nr:MAG: hypothetical protein LQ348_006524 [Seirophora lacunosa]